MGPPSADAPLFAAAETRALVARVALPIAVDELFDYAVPPELDAAARPGCRVRVRLGKRRVVGVIAERPEAARYGGELRPIEELVDAEPAIVASLLAVLREEAAELLCPVGIALAAALVRGPKKARKAAAPPVPPSVERDVPPTLTSEQAKALDPIAAAVRAREARTFLLHGVTGSGKTEVYLRAVAEALAAGRQALVLVPEISLTHQIVMRLRARFGDALAILHSGLRPRERQEQWRRLRGGEMPIAVGARSALFAPVEALGVIVIDEEHDGAYKNEEGFRYHARELAARRAAHARCPLVLGSATPSIETRFAADRGRIARLALPWRIGGRPLPAVEIVDLAEERRLLPRGRKLIFSRALATGLQENLARGGQAILLLNRRGFSTRILCFACGHAERCENCDVALVFHAADEKLRCHYCDLRREPPAVCSGCGAEGAALLGIGTERVEEALRRLLPDARIARLDRDTAARRGFGEQVLADLRDGRLDVVVGTQIVAKGHDFPGVRLVGVILADITDRSFKSGL
jgi:primosomal protein N' (replication factor Y)